MTDALVLPRLALGASVRDPLLVLDRHERRKRDGEPFWVLTLSNRSGRIDSAPVWHDQASWIDGASAGRVVHVVGEVDAYGASSTARRQLRLTAPLRPIAPADCRLEDFLPTVAVEPARLWSALDGMRRSVRSSTLRTVLARVFDDAPFRAAFARAPGSTQGHHAAIGGLLQHTVEVARIARHAARALVGVHADLALAGALLHDIGKTSAYAVDAGGFTHTPDGLLIGHVVLGMLHLDARIDGTCDTEQRRELRHLLLSHHGALEFGSPIVPMTPEAELVHWADQASAKGTDQLDARRDDALWTEGDPVSRRSWLLGRRLWRPTHGWP